MRNTLILLMLLCTGIGNASELPQETSPCPGLVSSWDLEKFERVLVVTDTEFTSIEDCERLGGFFFGQRAAADHSLDYSQLAVIVDGIWQPQNEDAPRVLLEAVLSWLKRLGLDEHAASIRELIDEYLPAESSVQLFFNAVIWLIVIAALALIVHEFYRAGMLRLPRRKKPDEAAVVTEVRPGMQWDEILGLPLREQMGALMQYSIDHLAAAGLVPASPSYTCRELEAHLERSDAAKAVLFRAQIELTEPAVFGDEAITEQQLNACRSKSLELSDA